MSSASVSIIEKINEHIHKEGSTVNAFCKDKGLKRSSVSSIMNGNITNPGIDTVIELAKALDCSVPYLLGISNKNAGFSMGFAQFHKKEPCNWAVMEASFTAVCKLFKPLPEPTSTFEAISLLLEFYECSMADSRKSGKKPKFNKEYAKTRADFIKECAKHNAENQED